MLTTLYQVLHKIFKSLVSLILNFKCNEDEMFCLHKMYINHTQVNCFLHQVLSENECIIFCENKSELVIELKFWKFTKYCRCK